MQASVKTRCGLKSTPSRSSHLPSQEVGVWLKFMLPMNPVEADEIFVMERDVILTGQPEGL